MKADTAWIQTYTGRAFSLTCPRVEDVSGEDIAHALANQCRFSGHTRFHYSVAQHCCLVADWLLEKTNDRKVALWGLLHDGAEAYICDVPTPLKNLLPEYRAIEKMVQRVVNEAYGLTGEAPPDVAAADLRILMDEREALLGITPQPWCLDARPLGVSIRPWEPWGTKLRFLHRLEKLTGAPEDPLYADD